MLSEDSFEMRPGGLMTANRTVLRKASRLAVLVAALMLAFGSSPAMAEGPYKESDSGYLKVVDTFLYPVGAVLEWTIFRPLHALELRGVRGVRTGRTSREGTMHVQRGCASARPPRYCTDVRFQN